MGILISLLEYFLPKRVLESSASDVQSRVYKRPRAGDEYPGCSPRRRSRFSQSSNLFSTPPSDFGFNVPSLDAAPHPLGTNYDTFRSSGANPTTQTQLFGSPQSFSNQNFTPSTLTNLQRPHMANASPSLAQSRCEPPNVASDRQGYPSQFTDPLPSSPRERAQSESMSIIQSNTRLLRKERLPDTFAGVKTELQDYLCHFDTVSRSNGWDDRDKGTNLAISLRGSAQQVLRDLPLEEREDYDAIVTALKRRFDPDERETQRRSELRHRQRHRNESAVEFGFALLRLVNSAYPNMPLEARETLTIEHFMAGLTNRECRKHVSFNHPTSIHQAISLATEFESFDTPGRKPEDAAIRAVSRKEDKDISHMLKTLSAQVKSLSEAQTSLEARLSSQNPNPHMYPQSRPLFDNQFQVPPPNLYPPRSQQPQRNLANVPKNAQGLGQRQQRR